MGAKESINAKTDEKLIKLVADNEELKKRIQELEEQVKLLTTILERGISGGNA